MVFIEIGKVVLGMKMLEPNGYGKLIIDL